MIYSKLKLFRSADAESEADPQRAHKREAEADPAVLYSSVAYNRPYHRPYYYNHYPPYYYPRYGGYGGYLWG